MYVLPVPIIVLLLGKENTFILIQMRLMTLIETPWKFVMKCHKVVAVPVTKFLLKALMNIPETYRYYR